MGLPEDMDGFKGSEHDDPFQLLTPGNAIRALVTVCVIAAALEAVLS